MIKHEDNITSHELVKVAQVLQELKMCALGQTEGQKVVFGPRPEGPSFTQPTLD